MHHRSLQQGPIAANRYAVAKSQARPGIRNGQYSPKNPPITSGCSVPIYSITQPVLRAKDLTNRRPSSFMKDGATKAGHLVAETVKKNCRRRCFSKREEFEQKITLDQSPAKSACAPSPDRTILRLGNRARRLLADNASRPVRRCFSLMSLYWDIENREFRIIAF
jgi:hypothetical protein